jgi:hypothetical protein
MRSYGWLFDVYPAQTTMIVWLYQDNGTLLRLEHPFHPRLYARGRLEDLRRLARLILRLRLCRRAPLCQALPAFPGAAPAARALWPRWPPAADTQGVGH